jgi:membrane protease subunit (stomatin/prohibitin family)
MSIWNFVRGELIDIVEWVDDTPDTMVWRFPRPDNEIKNGAKLIVRESQVAAFINEGQLADLFLFPGTFTLATQNLPVLSTLRGWKYGFDSPFKAEVYFVSTKTFTGHKWGTKNPIMLRDPEFGPVRLRAFGTFAVKVVQPATFLKEIVGTNGRFSTGDIAAQLRDMVVARFADTLGESRIPLLDLASNYDELGQFITSRIKDDFAAFGLEVVRLWVENISLPPEVEQALDKRTSMGIVGDLHKYAQFQSANAMEKAAENPGGAGASGIGMGMGFAMANQMGQMFGNAQQGQSQPQIQGHGQGSPPQLPPGAGGPPALPQQQGAAEWYVAYQGQQTGPARPRRAPARRPRRQAHAGHARLAQGHGAVVEGGGGAGAVRPHRRGPAAAAAAVADGERAAEAQREARHGSSGTRTPVRGVRAVSPQHGHRPRAVARRRRLRLGRVRCHAARGAGRRGPRDPRQGRPRWRDMEVLGRDNSTEAFDRLRDELAGGSAATRAWALREVNAAGRMTPSVFDRKLGQLLDDVTVEDGLTPALLLAGPEPGPHTRAALERGVRERPEVALHFAAALLDLAGLGGGDTAAFNPRFRPTLLKLLPNEPRFAPGRHRAGVRLAGGGPGRPRDATRKTLALPRVNAPPPTSPSASSPAAVRGQPRVRPGHDGADVPVLRHAQRHRADARGHRGARLPRARRRTATSAEAQETLTSAATPAAPRPTSRTAWSPAGARSAGRPSWRRRRASGRSSRGRCCRSTCGANRPTRCSSGGWRRCGSRPTTSRPSPAGPAWTAPTSPPGRTTPTPTAPTPASAATTTGRRRPTPPSRTAGTSPARARSAARAGGPPVAA